MSALSNCHLLGESAKCQRRQYRYDLGRGIVFGDDFVHATETGHAPHPMVFLCFTFGNQKMTQDQWLNTRDYIAYQCPLFQDPSGHLVKSAA
ncbi:unnamed protein product [Polarella glacialis]|uniref:Uncharacterized protein n=1 Tax=Polarella glacialis TaxID=89957 RepID=A0A813LLG9_POLGL|nr:unnamed protein product [Polarella glacialis]